jgi:hypothetical protein
MMSVHSEAVLADIIENRGYYSNEWKEDSEAAFPDFIFNNMASILYSHN